MIELVAVILAPLMLHLQYVLLFKARIVMNGNGGINIQFSNNIPKIGLRECDAASSASIVSFGNVHEDGRPFARHNRRIIIAND